MPSLLKELDGPVPIVLAPTGMVPTRELTPHVPPPGSGRRTTMSSAG